MVFIGRRYADIFTDWKLYVMISLNTLMLIGFCVELKVLPEATGNIIGACALVVVSQ